MKMTKTKTLREKEMKIMLRTIKEQQKEMELLNYKIRAVAKSKVVMLYPKLLEENKEQQKEIIDLKKHIYLKEATGDAEGIVSFGGRIAPQKPRSILDRLRINRKDGNGGENEDD